jgi:hypothetical protein
MVQEKALQQAIEVYKVSIKGMYTIILFMY